VFLSNASLAQADIGALTALSALARDHLVIKASVTDPEVTLMSTYRENSVAVYDAAAAEKTLFDESAGASLLSRSGVVVLSELPEDLPPKLSDKYIELKAAGRL
jgi:tRNA A37 threonylcarbamoyladenosine biosynthesis protein TsaE